MNRSDLIFLKQTFQAVNMNYIKDTAAQICSISDTLEIHFDTSGLGCRRRPAVLFINICYHSGGQGLLRKVSPAMQKLFNISTLSFSDPITFCCAFLPALSAYTAQQGCQFKK